MKLSQIQIKGFRNFKDTIINLSQKSLVIGPNDIGKTNLIYAIRILLDKSLSTSDIEPKDTDFYAYEDTNEYTITLKFENVIEDCLVSTFGKHGAVDKNGNLYLRYQATKDTDSSKDYKFFAAESLDALPNKEIQGRFYLKHLNLSYVNSNRDLNSFLRKEKKRILEGAKEIRTKKDTASDNIQIVNIKTQLEAINESINQLSYITSSTLGFNKALKDLSVKHEQNQVSFDSGAIDPEKYISNLELVSKVGDKKITAGGDGRNNQLFLAMWSSRIDHDNPSEITICCIEEPEAHLHPHQQRKLAEYLSKTLTGQVFITSHSPQIACEFLPSSIIKLYNACNQTKAASNGCSDTIDEAFDNFAHRLNIVPAEAFFSDVVFLVEGVSECLFYKSLASQIEELDIDRHNISILSVEGIGFKPYVKILSSLHIPLIIRTDNDYSRVKNKEKFSCVGLRRAIDLAKIQRHNENALDTKDHFHDLESERFDSLPSNIKKDFDVVKALLEEKNIFIAKKDLENDLADSNIKGILESHYECKAEELIEKMQSNKGISMFKFLCKNANKLSSLSDHPIALPLFKCKEIVDKIYGTYK